MKNMKRKIMAANVPTYLLYLLIYTIPAALSYTILYTIKQSISKSSNNNL